MQETHLVFTLTRPTIRQHSDHLYQVPSLPLEYSFWRWWMMDGVRNWLLANHLSEPAYDSFRPEFLSRPNKDFVWLHTKDNCRHLEFWRGDISRCPFLCFDPGVRTYVPRGWVKQVLAFRTNSVLMFTENGHAVTADGQCGPYMPAMRDIVRTA
ncbi:MAG: hypothetical protein KGI59_01710 [Patescibacteria group bacterium]|nr:hypothetical protein [Patescibacteria group bacterium]MDE2172551.1 hypothetical protein [Patescibacteria group bacterium]